MHTPEPDDDLMCRETMLEEELVRARLEVERLRAQVSELHAMLALASQPRPRLVAVARGQ